MKYPAKTFFLFPDRPVDEREVDRSRSHQVGWPIFADGKDHRCLLGSGGENRYYLKKTEQFNLHYIWVGDQYQSSKGIKWRLLNSAYFRRSCQLQFTPPPHIILYKYNMAKGQIKPRKAHGSSCLCSFQLP